MFYIKYSHGQIFEINEYTFQVYKILKIKMDFIMPN